MSRLEKEIKRIKLRPKDYTYNELQTLLYKLNFYENNKGRTSGARVEFKDNSGRKLILHKPHPGNILKTYQINDVVNELEKWRVI